LTYAVYGVLDVLDIVEAERAVHESLGPELHALRALEQRRWSPRIDVAVAAKHATSTTVCHRSRRNDTTHLAKAARAPQEGESRGRDDRA
jgi:alpha-beta hydrolase superfamily lysophospholipase